MRLVIFTLMLLSAATTHAINGASGTTDTPASEQSAIAPHASEGEVKALETRISALEQELAILDAVSKARLDAQDQRVGDLNTHSSQHGNHIAAISNVTEWVGIGIALIALIAGFITYFSATARARSEAKQAAESWLNEHKLDLDQQMASLSAQVDALSAEANTARQAIARTVEGVNDHAENLREAIDSAAKELLRPSTPDDSPRSAPAAEAIAVVEAASAALKAKPENDFTVDDHFARGLSEFNAGRFDSALISFDAAWAGSDSKEPAQTARILFARGVTLGQLQRSEEAIAVYDEVDRRYGQDLSLRELVAQSLFNKGVTLRQLERSEEAIAVCDEVDRRYGQDLSPALREPLAKSLLNKAVTLEQLEHSEEAIAVYDEVDRHYGQDLSPALREWVAAALKARAFSRLLQTKRQQNAQAQSAIEWPRIIEDLRRARLQCRSEDLAMVLGNLGYALFLSGAIEEAETVTRECLRLGGLKALNAQRGDAKLHRIEDLDSAYERMLDRLWAELETESTARPDKT